MTAISQAMGTKLRDFCANQFLVKCPRYFVRRPCKNCPFETLPDTWPEKMPSSQIEYFSIQNCPLYFKGDYRKLIDIDIVVPILMMIDDNITTTDYMREARRGKHYVWIYQVVAGG